MYSQISRTDSSSPRRKLRAGAVAVLCASLLGCNTFRAAPPTTPSNQPVVANAGNSWPPPGSILSRLVSASSPHLIPAPPGEADREDLDGRDDWFYFQRTYPSHSLPRDARRAAWDRTRRIKISSPVGASASGKWRPIGPSPTVPAFSNNWGLTSGRVNAVAVSPGNPRVVIAGSSTGGIWRSSNDGNSFVPVTDDHVDLAVGSIAFSKSNTSVVYAGMGDTKLGYLGSGVLKSVDEGRSWTRVSNTSLPSPGTISKIEVDPTNPNRVYVAQYSKLSGAKVTSSGFFISTDGGVNWTRTLAGAPRDIAVDPGNPSRLYLGLSRIDPELDPAFGLYRSTDRGTTWSAVFTDQFDLTRRRDIRVATTPADPQALFVYYGGSSFGNLVVRLKVSTDRGVTFSERDTSLFDTGQFGYNTYITASPADANTVYLGSRDVYKSTDAGTSWTNLTNNFPFANQFNFAPGLSKSHPDQHSLAFAPGNPDQFYIGNDGGISKTNDGGASFQSLNSTLALTQFVGLTIHPTNPAITYGGTQDNGSQRRSFGTGRWHEILVGDGGRVVLNPLDPSIVFVTYVRGNIFRYFGNGDFFDRQIAWNDSFGEALAGGPRIAFYPPFTGNGVDSTLYFGSWRLFLSANLGDSWFPPAGDLDFTKGITESGRDVLSAIAIARSDTRAIYTGSAQGRAMFSSDGGTTWSDVSNGLPDRSITSIAVDPANPATAYLAVSGFNTSHVFMTANSGATWTAISNGLPDIPVNALLIDPVVSNTLYAGSDVGVFRSTNGGAIWSAFDGGMPPVVVTQFTAQQTGLIQVSTYGRGAFEFAGNQRPAIDSASFDGKKKLTILGRLFGEAPRVLINGVDKSGKITSSSDGSITVKGKSKKLGLAPGDNTVQVITSDEIDSNVVTIRL